MSNLNTEKAVLHIDIVSDVVCPWCIVGYQQLIRALASISVESEIRWHPFELNPDMPREGENLGEHIARKYGYNSEESDKNRAHLIAVGNELGISFQFSTASRIYNTFDAHQLMHWADTKAQKHALKMALMNAYFTQQLDISNHSVLTEQASLIGLDADEASAVLGDQRFASAVREQELLWTSKGIRGVPAVVLNEKYLLSGAQGEENFRRSIKQVLEETSTRDNKAPVV